MKLDLCLRSQRVVTPEGVRPACVQIAQGRIVAVEAWEAAPEGCPVEDAGHLVVMPGIVDTHVHVNDPGRSEWEGFETATRAAAAGGVTTLMDMPLNSIPPTTTVRGLAAKRAAAEGKCRVDVALCGGLVPGNASELERVFDAGALAFKCFLAESGVDEFPHVSESDLEVGMRRLAELGAPLLVHAELPGPLAEAAGAALSPEEARRYAHYLASRPKRAEEEAVAMVFRLAARFGTRAHIVHLSASTALPILREARDRHLPVSAETCPHYLSFAAEDVPDGATSYKCAPPIRERANRDALWDALREGLLDQVVTDHSPASPSLKCVDSGDFMRAWGGIASLQLGLPAVWSGTRARGLSLEHLARWMCEGPAKLVGLYGRKGVLQKGADADFVVWDPDGVWTIDAARLEHRHKITPYDGRSLYGVVKATYLRGEKIYEASHGNAGADPFVGTPRGSLIGRGNV
ncbi:allantoinase AllB [Pendulispora albinea]|uniref:allantoinase n=1 Tax=Pendulispora albinea TaxID=2741071 RepID=A0ABZ2LRT8_9BACT